MTTDLLTLELSRSHFEWISRQVYELCGINLQAGKEGLVKSRLARRLRALRLDDFDHYLSYLSQDQSGRELALMVDELTTNKTSFFREPQHFDHLRQAVLPQLRLSGRPLRFWCAGCSSGEEPYTLSMLLREELPEDYEARILATDISARMLERASRAVYQEETLPDVPPKLRQKYFTVEQARTPRTFRVNDNVRELVRFARLNLMETWPMQGPFDAIFCRNVMIYFDKPTQQALVGRYAQLLAPGGLLFVGHSESLTSISHSLQYVKPAIYVK